MKQIIKIVWRNFVPGNIRSRIKDILEKDPLPSLKETFKPYIDALKKSCIRTENNNQIEEIFAPVPLLEAFEKFEVDHSVFPKNFWSDFVEAARTLDKNGKELQNRLIEEIENLSLQKVVLRDFMHFYSMAVFTGLLNVGFELRTKAREAAISAILTGNIKTDDEELYGLTALFELCRYKEVGKHFKKTNGLSKKYKRLLKHNLNIYSQSVSKSKDVGFNESDQKFHNYINNKSIAIVGPAKTDHKDAQEIENFDVVVRCNYKEEGVGVDDQIKGTRCDVTYFNHEQQQHLINEDQINWPTGIHWVVCKKQKDAKEVYERVSSTLNGSSGSDLLFNFRALINMNHVQFNGSLNSIPNIVLDLLRFHPEKIKIFHADLMLTVDRQKGYYPEEWNRDKKMKKDYLKSSSRAHDPVTQYNLLRNLWVKGLIEGDERFNMVMSLGEEEYMRRMQSIYGNAGRIRE